MALTALLWLRGLFNVAFGLSLFLLLHAPGVHGYLRGGGYALVDGLFGIAIAALLMRERVGWLAGLAAIDGVVRFLIGMLILSNPGMHRMVLASLFFFDCVALACVAEGAVGLVSMALNRRSATGVRLHRYAAMAVAAIAGCTLLLGIGLMFEFLEGEQRVLLSLYAVLVGVLWCFIGRARAMPVGARAAPR